MQTTPLLKFTIAGGSEPSTMISMRIFQNGEAIILVENGWPILKNTAEVGVYTMHLSQEKLLQLKQQVQNVEHIQTSYGEKLPGSLRYNLQLANKKMQWDHFASIPNTLEVLKNSLMALFQHSLEHNYQTLKAHSTISDNKARITLQNTGKLPITVLIPEHEMLKKRTFLIATIENTEQTQLQLPQLYGAAVPFENTFTETAITILPKDSISFQSHAQLPKDKSYIVIIETQWEKIPSIEKNIYSLLCVKATQK
jgi:hypothetical protein